MVRQSDEEQQTDLHVEEVETVQVVERCRGEAHGAHNAAARRPKPSKPSHGRQLKPGKHGSAESEVEPTLALNREKRLAYFRPFRLEPKWQ